MFELKAQKLSFGGRRLRAQADRGFYLDFASHFQKLRDAETMMVAIRSVVLKLCCALEFPGELVNSYGPLTN